MRVSVSYQINDYIVNSILRILKKVIPAQEYVLFYQDLMDLFSKDSSFTQFELFANYLISVMTGTQCTLITK